MDWIGWLQEVGQHYSTLLPAEVFVLLTIAMGAVLWSKVIRPALIYSIGAYRRRTVRKLTRRVSIYEEISEDSNKIIRMMIVRGTSSIIFLVLALAILFMTMMITLPEIQNSKILNWPFEHNELIVPQFIGLNVLLVVAVVYSIKNLRAMVDLVDLSKTLAALTEVVSTLTAGKAATVSQQKLPTASSSS